MGVGSSGSARLEELLDQVRLFFDSVSQDVEHSKSQHNDYERRGLTPLIHQNRLYVVATQLQEIGQMRNHLYELEKMHNRIKESYTPSCHAFLTISVKMRKSPDCVAKKPSWKEKCLPPLKIVECHLLPPPRLVSDQDYSSLNSRPEFGTASLFLGRHNHMIHI